MFVFIALITRKAALTGAFEGVVGNMSYESREKEYWRLKVEVKIRAGNGKKRWKMVS